MDDVEEAGAKKAKKAAHNAAMGFMYVFENLLCNGVLFFVIPGYYMYLIVFVRLNPESGPIYEICHFVLSLYGCVNIAGNMIMSLLTDLSVKDIKHIKDKSRFCVKCNEFRPTNSYHCRFCKVCVLNRDHHCSLFATCVGLGNLRYYILYVLDIIIAMLYYNYCLYYHVCQEYEKEGVVLTFYQLISPFIRFLYTPLLLFQRRELELLGLYANFSLAIWASTLLYFHGLNALRGIYSYEAHKDTGNSLKKALYSWRSWKKNIVRVFGTRWYFAVLWPFANSPLPHMA